MTVTYPYLFVFFLCVCLLSWKNVDGYIRRKRPGHWGVTLPIATFFTSYTSTWKTNIWIHTSSIYCTKLWNKCFLRCLCVSSTRVNQVCTAAQNETLCKCLKLCFKRHALNTTMCCSCLITHWADRQNMSIPVKSSFCHSDGCRFGFSPQIPGKYSLKLVRCLAVFTGLLTLPLLFHTVIFFIVC